VVCDRSRSPHRAEPPFRVPPHGNGPLIGYEVKLAYATAQRGKSGGWNQDYCLSTGHPEGRHKARVFYSVLGLSSLDAKELQVALFAAARENEAIATDQDAYGQRYVIDFVMRRGGREATVRSSWIIRTLEDFPRLTSCFIL